MRLVNMEVDRNGSQQRLRLGPLSPGLNAICGAAGSGKSTLLAWLRMLAAEDAVRHNGHTSYQPLSGVVELLNDGQHYQISSDRHGRVRVEPGRPSLSTAASQRWDGRIERNVDGNLTAYQRQAFEGLAAVHGTLDQAFGLQRLAQQLGLDRAHETSNAQREELLRREHAVQDRLRQLAVTGRSRESLLARQRQLEAELETTGAGHRGVRYEGQEVEQRRLAERLAVLEADLRDTQQEIGELDRQIAQREAELKLLEAGPAEKVGTSYRVQLQQLDDRLDRWRKTLKDLKAHRETLESNATDARLDEQIGDQLAATKDADPRAAMRSLESQIMHTRQQLDELVEHYRQVPGYDHRSASAAMSGTRFRTGENFAGQGVYRDANGQTYVGHPGYLPEATSLPETLRSMQKDLHEVCQQLARHEAQAATKTLKQQSLQLQRCETELLQAVEKLIEERAALLRTIAADHHLSVEQLTLAFGQWCQCHDHPHLREWLMSEESPRPNESTDATPDRQRLLTELDGLNHSRTQAKVRADNCRRQIRDADLHRLGTRDLPSWSAGRRMDEVQRDLQRTVSELAELTERERLETELRELRQQLDGLSQPSVASNPFQRQTDKHIAGLMGSSPSGRELQHPAVQSVSRRYDLVDGVVSEVPETSSEIRTSRPVPSQIVDVAMRLAIAEGMAAKRQPISLVLDGCLDTLSPELQSSAVAHVARVAESNQQILVLTADRRLADLVSHLRGWVGELQPATFVPDASQHVNQQLSALANDHEADKWNQPNFTAAHSTGTFLMERSLIEDLPAIDPTIAARCRALGVDRIGDLLDVDPQWLAQAIRIDGVSGRTVTAWQAIASLLCSVRKLRPFDARVLVGAGIESPAQLAAMRPSQLLERVERFLATTTGRRILNSGNSYELSRITSWIASAKGGARRYERTNVDREASGRPSLTGGYSEFLDRDEQADDYRYDHDRRVSSRRERNSAPRRTERTASSGQEPRAYPVIDRAGRSRTAWSERGNRDSTSQSRSTQDFRFYLELASPVVDAPSIGPRMAERLEEHGIETVDQLLAASPEELADQLDHRRVDAATVRAWQEQAQLVCRIPNLRGHDAQLLVACDLTSPEELATLEADEVLAQVSEVAESAEGQRILRGGKEPDLEEVQNWIAWASHCRKLSAA